MQEDGVSKNPYLNLDQIAHIREQVEAMDPKSDDIDKVLALVDHYVRANGNEDDDYERIFAMANSVAACRGISGDNFPFLFATLPILVGLSFYNYLLGVGVFSAKELEELNAANSNAFNVHPIPKA